MNKLSICPKCIFLIDAFGASMTILLLGGVLARWHHIFGMSPQVLYKLVFIACFYAIFSFFCYFNFEKIAANWKTYLKIIAIANMLYCILTFILMIYFFQQLTILGLFYFSGEIIIILTLAIFEFRFRKS